MVAPSMSILAEPPVAVVDRVAKRHGSSEVAKAYLQFLYSEQGQEIAAKNFYRPRMESVRGRYAGQFPKIELFTVDSMFGGWQKAHLAHFGENGSFDRIVRK
jgi:sulfate transport system substrate-binding protein